MIYATTIQQKYDRCGSSGGVFTTVLGACAIPQRTYLHRRDTQRLETTNTTASNHVLCLLLLLLLLLLGLCGAWGLLRELQCLAGGKHCRALLFEIRVEYGHLLARLFPVFGVPVRVCALLAAENLRGGRCSCLFRDPQTKLLVVSPVPVPPAQRVNKRE